MHSRHPTTPLVSFIKRWRVKFALLTVLFYAVALVLVAFLFPDVSNLWVTVFVLISGFTAGIATLADLLVNAEESIREDGEDPGA